jgi:hypothetical protein
MMSSRRRAGFSEGKGAVSVDLCLKALFAHRLFDDVHLATKNAGKSLFELAQAAEIIEAWPREIPAEAYRHIDIVRGILPAGDRAEQGYAQHTGRAEFLLMRLQGGYDLVAFHGTSFAQLLGTNFAGAQSGIDPPQYRIERRLRDYLGADRVIWLRNGIAGDDTHGHLARFVEPDAVVVASEGDRSDGNYEPLRENYALLKEAGLRVTKLPMPRPVVFAGRRLPASYANFYIANGLVLAPTFNDPADRVALNTLAKCFPDREVTGIDCTGLIWGLGALHCMTQQQPA